MPNIASFYGIVIYMYYKGKEHNPAHIHAVYGSYTALIELNGNILVGYLPSRAKVLVLEWIQLHKEELKNMWDTQDFHKIKPLS